MIEGSKSAKSRSNEISPGTLLALTLAFVALSAWFLVESLTPDEFTRALERRQYSPDVLEITAVNTPGDSPVYEGSLLGHRGVYQLYVDANDWHDYHVGERVQVRVVTRHGEMRVYAAGYEPGHEALLQGCASGFFALSALTSMALIRSRRGAR